MIILLGTYQKHFLYTSLYTEFLMAILLHSLFITAALDMWRTEVEGLCPLAKATQLVGGKAGA